MFHVKLQSKFSFNVGSASQIVRFEVVTINCLAIFAIFLNLYKS